MSTAQLESPTRSRHRWSPAEPQRGLGNPADQQPRGTEELRRLAHWAQDALAGASAGQVLAWAYAEFGDGVAVASSMADAVLPHLAATVYAGVRPDGAAPQPSVIFLDTGYHFEETLATRDQVSRRLPVRVINATPRLTVQQQDEAHGTDLFGRDPGACCRMRKVEPLRQALTGYQAWASGLRRSDSPTRAHTPLVSWDERHGIVKLNPLAAWSDEHVNAYIRRHDVPVNPLIEQGYPSIGCGPCTLRPLLGADSRSGRWAGTAKTECGLHT
ncbi:MAG: phosphoadenylyl-sulfate reductase [Ornithinimicrobium sp.]